jgi:thymidylate kinase
MLSKHLIGRGNKVKTFEVPIFGLITYPLIYGFLKTGLAKLFPNVFQTLQVLNRLIFQLLILPFYLKKCNYVIFDRWALSSLIYGGATGVNNKYNKFLYDLMIVPDVTLVINGPVRNSESRDSYEADKGLQAAVRVDYAMWCKNNPLVARMISSEGSRDEVHQKMIFALYELLKKV